MATPPKPEKQTADGATDGPTVNFLFSGGVFRGVFQVGVVTAASEMHLHPHVIAGASVGSIMGAMVANVFNKPGRNERRRQLANVAAAFLALDRLVVTDRVWDFAGRLGLRAASANFSLFDCDRLFRQFELPASLASRTWRRAVAGIERLFYLNPFDLKDLTAMVRRRQFTALGKRLGAHAQNMLERYGVGSQLLGAEPLAMLISKLVIEKPRPEIIPFNCFEQPGDPLRPPPHPAGHDDGPS